MTHFYVTPEYMEEHDNELLLLIEQSFEEYYQNTDIRVKPPLFLASHLQGMYRKKTEYIQVWEQNGTIIAYAWYGLDFPVFTEPVSTVRMFYTKPIIRKTSLAARILLQMLDVTTMPQDLLHYPHLIEVVSQDETKVIATAKRFKGVLLASTFFRPKVLNN